MQSLNDFQQALLTEIGIDTYQVKTPNLLVAQQHLIQSESVDIDDEVTANTDGSVDNELLVESITHAISIEAVSSEDLTLLLQQTEFSAFSVVNIDDKSMTIMHPDLTQSHQFSANNKAQLWQLISKLVQ